METCIAAGIGILVAVITQVTALRIGGRYLRACGFGLMLGSAAVLISTRILMEKYDSDLVWLSIGSQLIFMCGWFVFLNFIQSAESSLRVQILRYIISSPDPISKPVLAEKYSDSKIIGLRLERLIRGKAVVFKDGCYHIESLPLLGLARSFRLLKNIIVGAPSEFKKKNTHTCEAGLDPRSEK